MKVTIVIDKEHLGEIQSKGSPDLEVVTRNEGEGHLHHKILVVDGKEIWIGSANFTTSAYETQENLMVRFVSAELGQYLHHEADVFRGTAEEKRTWPVTDFSSWSRHLFLSFAARWISSQENREID